MKTSLRSSIAIVGLITLVIVLAGLQPAAAQTTFTHPGVLVSKAQLDYIKAQVQTGQGTIYQEYLWAVNSTWGTGNWTPLTYTQAEGPYPGGVNQCGSSSSPDNGCKFGNDDSSVAYIQALLWYITGNKTYATNAINIMNAYARNLKGFAGYSAGYPCPGDPTNAQCSNGPLQAAWDSEKWPRAAEIIRYSNAGWADADIKAFSDMLRNVYEPLIYEGAGQNGNWELSMIEGMMGIAVFNEDAALFQHAQDYWHQRVPAYFYYFPIDGGQPAPFPRNTTTTWNGQTVFNASVNGVAQETCRDFKHTEYGIAATMAAAETAHIQGVTLFEDEEPRLIAALEFSSKYEKSRSVPTSVCGGTATFGSGMTYVIGYNDYHNRLGQLLPNTQTWINTKVITNSSPTDSGSHLAVFEPFTHYADGAPATSPDFSLSASPVSQVVTAGNTTTFVVTLNPLDSYSGFVTLSVSGLPSGATAVFSPTVLSASQVTSTLTVTTNSTTPTGNSTLTVGGTDGILSHSAPASLLVNASGNPIPATITAYNESVASGGTLPILTYTVSPNVGFNALLSDVEPTCVSSADGNSAPGTYPVAITCSGAVKAGYTFTYVPGQMTVNSSGSSTLTITADDQTMTFGGSVPTLSYTVSPSVALDAAPTCVSSANGSSAPGSYPGAITCSGAVKAGYTVSYVAGKMTVSSVSATITANDQTMTFGGSVPTLSYAVSPSVSLDTVPTCVSSANGSSATGAYAGAISCSGAAKVGYSFTYIAGKMMVDPIAATITANDQTMVAGGSVPALTYTSSPSGISFTAAPTCTTTGTSASAAGTYPITCAGAVNANYVFTYNQGNLTITAVAANPVPAISSLNPPNVKAGSTSFTLAVTGTGFVSGSVVRWGGSDRGTTFVDSSHLTASITAADIASVGQTGVTVFTPAPGGGVSPAYAFATDSAANAPGAFTVTATTATLNIAQGLNTTLPVTFAALNNGAQIAVTCLNLPTGATCSFDSSAKTITVATTASTPKGQYQITVLFTVTQQIIAMVRSPIFLASWLGFAGLPVGLFWMGNRRKKLQLVMLVLLGLCLVLALSGCGSGHASPTSPTPTSATAQTSLPFTVNVN